MLDACLWSWWSSGLENVFSWHSFHWKNWDLLPIDCVSTIWRIFYPQMQLQKVFLHTQVFVLLQAFYSQHVLLGHYPISALLNKPRNSWKKGFPPWKNEVEENIEEDKTKKRKSYGGIFWMTFGAEQYALTCCGNDSIGIGYVMSSRLFHITTDQKMGKHKETFSVSRFLTLCVAWVLNIDIVILNSYASTMYGHFMVDEDEIWRMYFFAPSVIHLQIYISRLFFSNNVRDD